MARTKVVWTVKSCLTSSNWLGQCFFGWFLGEMDTLEISGFF